MRKILSIAFFLITGLSIWYLFIKEYDYQISFNANMAPGSAYFQVRSLNSWGKDLKAKNIEIIDLDDLKSIKQRIILEDTTFILDWKFRSIADTITKVEVGIIDESNSLKNRIQSLSGKSLLVSSIKKELIDFRKKLRYYTDSFRVVIDGKVTMPGIEYLAINTRTGRTRKANEMIRENAFLYPLLKDYNIKKDGFPFVKVNQWNIATDSIQFDFGFPIVIKDSLPADTRVERGKLETKKALKATYYGNYRNSDEAWFALVEYARKHDIEVEKKPLEIFYNNPMQGGNELGWKAEVFLPIINDSQ